MGVGLCQAAQHWVGVGERVTAWPESGTADRVRLGVRDEGVYRVTADEVALASGLSASAVRQAFESKAVSLTRQGRPVAWTGSAGELYFYGVPTEELFAPENVYWLAWGPGRVMQQCDAAPPAAGSTNQWFIHEEHYRPSFLAPYEPRDRRSSNGTLTNVLNFGEWVPSSSSEATSTQSRLLVAPGLYPGAATGVTVRVELASYRDFVTPDSHTCEVRVNGVSCGSQSWLGERAVTFDYAVPAGAVTGSPLLLSVRNAGGEATQSDFMILDAALFYPRAFTATNDALVCSGGVEATVAAEGFTCGQLAVWDITDPDAPVELLAPVTQGSNGLWQAAFLCGGDASRYAAFAVPTGPFEPSVCGARDIDWRDAREMPELAIVIPPRRWVSGFGEAVQPLAAFREAQGLRTRVIDAEAIYNAFSDGLAHPEAFRRFSAAGVTNAAGQTLRYLLFAGHGGSDYKLDVFRLGEPAPYPTLFPLYLFPQVEVSVPGAVMLPNDVVLGDVTGGGAPEVAVGRFLATNAVELAHMVNKTIRYELTETWRRKAVFSADWQNTGTMYANFPGIAAATASGFPGAGWWTEPFYPAADQSYLGTLWKNTYYKTGVYYELHEGAGFFYYVGHSSDTIAGNSGPNKLFDAPMFRSGTWPFAPVALLMGCRMGRWTLLDIRTELQSIAEAGVRNRFSGFTAVLSAAGYMTTAEASNFSYAFRDRVAAGALRLGDAWRGTFAALGDDAAAQLHHMALLGDPSLCLRVDQTACGTPTAWLIEEGLTNDPYADLRDQDNDGFATWMECQAGTSYARGGVRFKALTLPAATAGVSALSSMPEEDGPGIVLEFEPLAGLKYRVVSTADLTGGCWQQVPWRPVGGREWSWSSVEGDWPLKSVEVPFGAGTLRRFYKIVTE